VLGRALDDAAVLAGSVTAAVVGDPEAAT